MTTFSISLDTLTDAAAEAVLAARDFCGNELEAARDAFRENGVEPSDLDLQNAVLSANFMWDRQRKEARQAA